MKTKTNNNNPYNAAPLTPDRAKLHQRKTWLVNYAVTNTDGGDARTLTSLGIVEATDIRDAEDVALRAHASEGFNEDEPFEPQDYEGGEWTTYDGFRAFQLSYKHSAVDAGSILWIESIREVEETDALTLKKYLARGLSYEQLEADQKEQHKLRAIQKERD